MNTQLPRGWVERLKELHPLLHPPSAGVDGERAREAPAANGDARGKAGKGATLKAREWQARKAEMDAAAAADAAAARERRAHESRRIEKEYDNGFATWAGVAVAVIAALVGLFLVERLIQESKLENCLASHRAYCDQIINPQ